jgi:hypothetical protein
MGIMCTLLRLFGLSVSSSLWLYWFPKLLLYSTLSRMRSISALTRASDSLSSLETQKVRISIMLYNRQEKINRQQKQ